MSETRPLVFSALDTTVHDRQGFGCAEPALTRYLQQQATQDVQRNVARVFVGCFEDAPTRILSYYTLSSAHVLLEELPEDQRKKLPRYPVPVILMGRLVVDALHGGQGLGRDTLFSALERAYRATEQVAAWAVVVDAKSEGARAFYEKYGFLSLPASEKRLFLPIQTLKALM